MSRKPVSTYGVAPRERVPRPAPRPRAAGQIPKGPPLAQAQAATVARAPRQHAAAKVPNPRKPKLVRDPGGGVLKDLFAIFADLPRPARPKARAPARIARGRGRR